MKNIHIRQVSRILRASIFISAASADSLCDDDDDELSEESQLKCSTRHNKLFRRALDYTKISYEN